ncbi:hypothetical protein FHX40_4538, partial [Thermopolyspora flexuosa]
MISIRDIRRSRSLRRRAGLLGTAVLATLTVTAAPAASAVPAAERHATASDSVDVVQRGLDRLVGKYGFPAAL